MSAEESKAIVRRLNDEVWNEGKIEVLDELVAEGFVGIVIGAPEQIKGPHGFGEFVAMYRKAFPDLRITIDEQIADGDTVVTRWTAIGTHQGELMGMPATGKQAATAGININRIADGKLVAGWGLFDQLGLLQQLGAIPTPARV